jgi:hypothetical protein
MRTRTFALLALAAGFGTPALAADKPEYKPFASSEGRYKVLFPGAVKSEMQELKTDRGPQKLTIDSVELGDDAVFCVTFLDVPEEATKTDPRKRLDKIRDGCKGANGKTLSEKDVTVGTEKFPGREVLIEKPDAVIRNRIVLAGTRMYQVMIEGPRSFVTSPDADRFFDSFQVTR